MQAANAIDSGGTLVHVESADVLTAAVGGAASRLCSRAGEVLWRAVVGRRASAAMVVSWRRERGNALIVGRHVELAAFTQVAAGGVIRCSCLSDRNQSFRALPRSEPVGFHR